MLNFKELRKKKNLTQKEFSELINVSMRALSNYENGNTDITLKKLQEIADLLEINFFELFQETGVSKVEELKTEYLTKEKEVNNYNILYKNYKLLKEQTELQEELNTMLKEKLQYTEEKLQQCEQDKKNISQVTG